MRTKATTVLLGVGAVAAVVLLSQGAHAQPGGSGSGEDASDTDKVYCPEDGSNAHYSEVLDGEGATMLRWAGSDTGCPNHVNWFILPNTNPAVETPSNTSIPAYPMLLENGNTTDLSEAIGSIGVLRNGVPMFSVKVESFETSAFYLEYDTLDLCDGHATPRGDYHYHSTAGCLLEQAGGIVGQHSPLLGWAYDGFPFYGQLGADGIEMKMCGADGAHPEVCLDACSGYEAVIDAEDFTYRYYTSCGFDESFFPFTANRFRGCCPEGATCGGRIETCGDNPGYGYTDTYVPEARAPLDDQYDTMLIDGDDSAFIGSNSTIDCSLYLGFASSTVSSSSTGNATLRTTPSPTPAATSSALHTSSPTSAGTSAIIGGHTAPSASAAAATSSGSAPSPEASVTAMDGETETSAIIGGQTAPFTSSAAATTSSDPAPCESSAATTGDGETENIAFPEGEGRRGHAPPGHAPPGRRLP